MIDVSAAVQFLQKLWNPDKGAFKEALTINQYHLDDNYLAWLVMRKYDPKKAAVLREGFIKGYNSSRWSILAGETKYFTPSPLVLPDYMRYADMVALQYLYLRAKWDFKGADLHFGILTKMYGLYHDGYIYDAATEKEGYTIYKLCLYALCSLAHNRSDLAEKLLRTASQHQVKEGDEAGGVKTEYIPPEWECRPEYHQLLRLANCETTCLAILAQDSYNSFKLNKTLSTVTGASLAAIGAVIAILRK